MAKKKTVAIRDLFVKLEKYYKDMYIINGTCFCEGTESFTDNPGYYFGILEPDTVTAIKETLPPGEVVSISSVREAKDRVNDGAIIGTALEDTEAETVKKKFQSLYSQVQETDDWLPFPLSEEEVSAIFQDGVPVEFPLGDLDFHISVTKSCFPGITEKRVYDLNYTVLKMDHGIIHLIFRYPFDYYTIYLLYAFLE